MNTIKLEDLMTRQDNVKWLKSTTRLLITLVLKRPSAPRMMRLFFLTFSALQAVVERVSRLIRLSVDCFFPFFPSRQARA